MMMGFVMTSILASDFTTSVEFVTVQEKFMSVDVMNYLYLIVIVEDCN